MKNITKNIVIIILLVSINLAIFIFCKILTSEENYIWNKITEEKATLLSYACLDIMRIRYFVFANSINLFLLGIYFAINYRKTLGFLVALISIGIYIGSTYLFEKNITENYYTIFKNQSVPDDFMVEPIKSAGPNIGPYLMEDIVHAYSPHRKFAIIGMGEIKFEPSVEILNTVVHDSKEKSEIRGEAYRALLAIGSEKSISYARIFMASYHPSSDEGVMAYLKINPSILN